MSSRDWEATWSLPIGVTAVVVAVVTGCGYGNSSSSPTSPTPSAVTVTIQTNARTLNTAAFVPNPATVVAGGVLTWSNTDSTTHDMVSDTGLWDSGRMAPGTRFDFTFPSRGSFPYHCSIHAGMVGTVIVQ
jgi:plastocyanin